MTLQRVLLVGYYGKGNFGDDLLLKVTHSLLKRLLPNAHFSVIGDGPYIKQLLGDVEILKPARHGHFDFIVHGGGGVFFDFKIHGMLSCYIGSLVQFFGFNNYVKLEKMIRHIMRKPRTSATKRLGIGIGVDTFTPGSPQLRRSLPILADFKVLWLRDAQSISNLQPFKAVMRAELIAGSDLAFLTDHWLPPTKPKPKASRPRLGIVLRDWPGTDINKLRQLLAQLSQKYILTAFIFDRSADPELQKIFADYVHHFWQPETTSISDYANLLGEQDVLLTSRAHAAICGACLGVPAVIVNITPKLEQIHTMLPNATVLAANDISCWQEAVQKALSISPEEIMEDVNRNRKASEAALLKIRDYFA